MMVENNDRLNKLFTIINNFERMFPEEFEKCGIKHCGHCGSTGIANRHSLEFCVYCGGIGYRGFEKIKDQFICRRCNGGGCSFCYGKGVVDWVTHANGNDIPNQKGRDFI